MLEIIYGESGTGKSELLYKKISEAAESGKKVFFFVPDQFSFEAEKQVFRTVKPPHTMNVKVTMFSREAHNVLQLHGETKVYADNIVKNMRMSTVLKELEASDRLLYYKKQLKNKALPAIMLGIISELKNGGVSPSSLRTVIAERGEFFSELLMNKLNDICEIYTGYDRLLTASFDDRLDDVHRAAGLVSENDYYRGAVCFFDNFDEFSGCQLEFVSAVCGSAEKAVFTVTTDVVSSDKTIFLAASKLIAKLIAMDEDYTLTEMKHRYRGIPQCEIVRARDLWQECDWICSKIHELIAEGYRYRDIAVLMPDKSYGQILKSAMEKYGISAFIDVPEPLINKSVVRFIIYTLQALSFETDDILRYVKSGFVRVGEADYIKNLEMDELEQFCRYYDIGEKDWLNPFPEEAKNGEKMEKLRVKIIKPLKALKKAMESKYGLEKTEALCHFVCNEMDIGKGIYSFYFRKENGEIVVDKEKQDEYNAIWDDVVEIFESAHEVLREVEIDTDDYINLLTDAFTNAKISKPPQVLDAVIVGDVERSRFTKKKAVFICGMNQGIFPRSAKTTGSFTGRETEQLVTAGLAIGGDRITRVSSELFRLYRCVNIPEERLFVTYSLLNDNFAQISASPYIEDIERHFSVTTSGADEYGADFYCRTEKAAEKYLAKIYSNYYGRDEKAAIIKQLGRDPFEGKTEVYGERHILSADSAEKLLSPDTYSPTDLNKINNCKYRFFCEDGLKIKENDKREPGAMLSGNVVHFCLEKLLKEYGGNLASAEDEEIIHHVRESVELYLKEKLLADFGASKRFRYQVKRLEELVLPAAFSIRQSMLSGQFSPLKFEEKVNYKFGDVTIKGTCDRIDISSDGEYIRVVDYKHGKNELKLPTVYDGENLQMLLYLFGFCEQMGKKPSAVLYQHIGGCEDKKAVSEDIENDIAGIEKENKKLHIANGVIVADTPAKAEAEYIDNMYNDMYKSSRKAKYANSPVISETDFESLKNYCRAYVNTMTEQVRKGMISAYPKNEKRCDYCIHNLYCGHKREKNEDE